MCTTVRIGPELHPAYPDADVAHTCRTVSHFPVQGSQHTWMHEGQGYVKIGFASSQLVVCCFAQVAGVVKGEMQLLGRLHMQS